MFRAVKLYLAAAIDLQRQVNEKLYQRQFQKLYDRCNTFLDSRRQNVTSI